MMMNPKKAELPFRGLPMLFVAMAKQLQLRKSNNNMLH